MVDVLAERGRQHQPTPVVLLDPHAQRASDRYLVVEHLLDLQARAHADMLREPGRNPYPDLSSEVGGGCGGPRHAWGRRSSSRACSVSPHKGVLLRPLLAW